MNKKLVGIFVMTLFLLTTINVVGTNEYIDDHNKIIILNQPPDDELDQYQDTYDNWLFFVHEKQWLNQQFIPSKQIITRVELYIFKWEQVTNYEITVSIRKEESGIDLTSVTLIPPLTYRGGDWIEFDFPDIALNIGETYHIVCSAYDGTNQDNMCYGWGVCLDNISYPFGDLYLSTNKGLHWNLCISSQTNGPIDSCFRTYGFSNDPPDSPTIEGPSTGVPNEEYLYQLTTLDPNEDDLCFFIDWGDNNTEETEYCCSGDLITVEHQWIEEGDYTLKVKALDIYGTESDWTILEVSMPKNKSFNEYDNWLYRLIQRFQILEFLI